MEQVSPVWSGLTITGLILLSPADLPVSHMVSFFCAAKGSVNANGVGMCWMWKEYVSSAFSHLCSAKSAAMIFNFSS